MIKIFVHRKKIDLLLTRLSSYFYVIQKKYEGIRTVARGLF